MDIFANSPIEVLMLVEGIMTFVSPCILPMVPVYILYLFGDTTDRTVLIINTLGFIFGFTLIFMALGAGASALGGLLRSHQKLLQQISGIIIIIFGLIYLDILSFNFLSDKGKVDYVPKKTNFFRAMVFGAAFSSGWTPCAGPQIGVALTLAANSETLWTGVYYLFIFSMGLGIPFLITAIAYEQIKPLFNFIKKHFSVVKRISGLLMIFVGLALLLDVFSRYQALFT